LTADVDKVEKMVMKSPEVLRDKSIGTHHQTNAIWLEQNRTRHGYTTNGPFRGFHIAPCKGGEWARNITASSTPPSGEARRVKVFAVEAISSLWI
jgi:hypothetical protein